jgi:hypothetical protein
MHTDYNKFIKMEDYQFPGQIHKWYPPEDNEFNKLTRHCTGFVEGMW